MAKIRLKYLARSATSIFKATKFIFGPPHTTSFPEHTYPSVSTYGANDLRQVNEDSLLVSWSLGCASLSNSSPSLPCSYQTRLCPERSSPGTGCLLRQQCR